MMQLENKGMLSDTQKSAVTCMFEGWGCVYCHQVHQSVMGPVEELGEATRHEFLRDGKAVRVNCVACGRFNRVHALVLLVATADDTPKHDAALDLRAALDALRDNDPAVVRQLVASALDKLEGFNPKQFIADLLARPLL